MSVKEDNSAILSQCLDFCQTLAGKSLNFSFTLTLGNNFSFSLDSSEKKALAPKAKKKSPSTLRRDARRRKEFVRKKLEASTGVKVFKCDQCGNNFKSENGLKIHVGKAHRKVNLATPDHLRQQPKRSVSLSASPLLDTSREEPCLNSIEVTREEVGEEKGEPVSPLQPSPSSPPSNPCTDCDEEITGLTWYRLGEPWCEDCVRVYVTTD